MKKLLTILIACASFALSASEAGNTLPNDTMPEFKDDNLIVSMQRGMQVYMNNCIGCHSLEFQRYNRTAADLQIPEQLMIDNLMFTGEKIGDLMENNMQEKKAKIWFGAAPPDLSLIARLRGTHWLYNYLRAFYQDETRPYGVNNSVFPNVGMPHALERLQGLQAKSKQVQNLEKEIALAKGEIASAKAELESGGDSGALNERIEKANEAIHHAEATLVELADKGDYFTLIRRGELDPVHFDEAITDLVNFLDYVGEPSKRERRRLGVFVLIFIAIFGVVAYFLKKEYWKDVH